MEFQNSSACAQVNAAPGHKQKPLGIQLKGTLPFEHLEVTFTVMKPCQHYYVPSQDGWRPSPPELKKQMKWLAVCFEKYQIRVPNQYRIRQWPCFCS